MATKTAGHSAEYGLLNWPITASILTERCQQGNSSIAFLLPYVYDCDDNMVCA